MTINLTDPDLPTLTPEEFDEIDAILDALARIAAAPCL